MHTPKHHLRYAIEPLLKPFVTAVKVASLLGAVTFGIISPSYAATFATGLNGTTGGLTFDGNGNLYVSNAGDGNPGNGTISKVSSGGGVASTFATGLNYPEGIVFDGSYFYVANSGGTTISKVDSTGTVVTPSWATGLNAPEGLAFYGGYLYVSNYNDGTISKVNSSTGAIVTPSWAATASNSGPAGIAFDGSGNLYVANFNSTTISKFDSSGTLVDPNWATGLSSPYGIAFDGSGNLYVANYTGSATISKFDSSGTLVDPNWATGLSKPAGLTVSGGYLYASDQGTNTILQFVVPVPFEFSPALGLSVLGGLWVGKRMIKQVRSSSKQRV